MIGQDGADDFSENQVPKVHLKNLLSFSRTPSHSSSQMVCVSFQNEDSTPVCSPTLSSPPFGLKPRSGKKLT